MILNLLILIFVIFIKIGDFVLFALVIIKRFFAGILSTAKNILSKSASMIHGFVHLLAKKTVSKITKERIIFEASHHFHASNHKKKSMYKKSHKYKEKNFFLFSASTKLKYFLSGVVFSFLFIYIPLLVFLFIQDLPNPKRIQLGQIPQTTKIYDRSGNLLYQIYAQQNRTLVKLDDIPDSLKKATIAIEDKDFYKHPGFDVTAIIRSAVENLSGNDLQGGSTITQQLIKSSLLTPETSIFRKIKEVVLAFWTERIYKKDQILEMYFNQIPYGGTAWGVEAAADVYFGKHVKDLNLPESAFLAGIPRAPSIYSPFSSSPNAWKKRQKEVLGRMIEFRYISKHQYDEALSYEIHFKPQQTPIYAAHFVMYVKNLLMQKYGIGMVEKGGLQVITSLDLKKQEWTQKIVSEEVENNAYLNLTNGAALITNPQNGDILAMIGSKDYSEKENGNVNLTTSLRQPGSSIKIVTYSAALSKGFTAATILDDSPVTYAYQNAPAYSPVNYDSRYHGKIPLRLALANSLNIPAVKTLNQIGIPTMVNLGKKMGITTWREPSQYGLSITLGGAEVNMLDMTTVYGVLANQGKRVDANPIIKITDSTGTVLEEKKQETSGIYVLDPGIAFIISDILADNNDRSMEFGTNSPLNIPDHKVSVKTGTSDNKRDNWTIGYTNNWVVATWVGNNDNSPMSESLASGITGAAPIWNKIMNNLLKGTSDQSRPIPDNVSQKACVGRLEYFIRGTENTVNCAYIPLSPTPKKEKNDQHE